jgi:hypothetical protein
VRRTLPALLCVLAVAAGCGGSSSGAGSGGSAGSAAVQVQPAAPRIKAFLKLPVATPSRCPSNVSGTTAGRISPWSGHIDISVFLDPHLTPSATAKLGAGFRDNPLVRRVFYESKAEAFAEFQRLYTCSASVNNPDIPASYRLQLTAGTTLAARNALVTQILAEPGVSTASCDPSNPCVKTVQSAQP